MARHRFVIEGKEYVVEIGVRVGNSVPVTVNGKTYTVEVADAPTAVAAPRRATSAPARQGAVPLVVPVQRPQAAPGDRVAQVRAPISGVVLSVAVTVGQAVSATTKLLVVEAMKMENEIPAGVEGVIESVLVKAQQEVRQGDLLVTIAPAQ